ncbi:MAG: NAD(+)/NADH kinase [Phycisphaerae bacterium]|nr:NAD(+)/NADH kinase [Phycisphaerae bacterium]
MTRTLIIAATRRPGTADVLAEVRRIVTAHSEIVGEFDVEDTLPPALKADRAVVVGGDGTIMAALRQLVDRTVPVVGVNTGRLGFLAEFDAATLRAHAKAVFGTEPDVRTRMVLAAQVRNAAGDLRYEGLAVNDCVVTAGAPFRMIELALDLGGEEGPEFLGDGIIVATPVGSTAYNASAGGPIVHPDVEALVVTPAAAHSLAFRPTVLPSHIDVVARVVRANEGTTLVLDGHINVPLQVGDRVTVSRHHAMARIVACPDVSYWQTLVDKLRWAARPKYREGT